MGLEAKLFICEPKLLRIRAQQPKAIQAPPGIASPTASRQIYSSHLCSSFPPSHASSAGGRGLERDVLPPAWRVHSSAPKVTCTETHSQEQPLPLRPSVLQTYLSLGKTWSCADFPPDC